MKKKLTELRQSIKALLDEAAALIEAGKLDEAKAKQEEAKTLRAQVETVKAQIEAEEEQAREHAEAEKAELTKKNADLEAKLKKPVTVEIEHDSGEQQGKEKAVDGFNMLKYGETEPALKAVISDIYGSGYNYNERRAAQMRAFVKYIRRGEAFLTAEDHDLLSPSAKNLILRPENLKNEIESGRTVGEIKATLEEASGDLGGNLVPEDYRAEIIKRLQGVTVVRGRARVVTTARDAIEWPRLEGGNNVYTSAVRVTWVDETPASATAAETNPTFGLIRIPVHTVMARTDLSRNLLEDSAFNLLDVMAGLFAEAMAVDEDSQFLTGTGAGRPYGVLGDRANGNQESIVTGVTDANTGNATALTADGFYDLVYSLPAQYRNNAVHVMARTTVRDARKLKDGNGQYLWQPGMNGQPSTLMGYPLLESENMPTVAANAYVDIFGDWRNGYVIVDRVGMSIERVTDSTTVGQNKVALFARRRLGGQTVAPWAFAGLQVAAS